MDNPTSQPVNTPAAAPETQPVSAPYSIPAGYTPEMARARLEELKSDREFGRLLLSGDKRASTEFDALTRHAIGQQQPEAAKAEPTPTECALEALGPPPKPEDYRIDTRDPVTGYPVKMDDATKTLVNGTLLPAAHSLGLSQSDLSLIGDYVVKPLDEARCEATLRRIWGANYEARLQDFRKAVADPKVRALFEEYPDTLGNNPALISSIVAASRRRNQARP